MSLVARAHGCSEPTKKHLNVVGLFLLVATLQRLLENTIAHHTHHGCLIWHLLQILAEIITGTTVLLEVGLLQDDFRALDVHLR